MGVILILFDILAWVIFFTSFPQFFFFYVCSIIIKYDYQINLRYYS